MKTGISILNLTSRRAMIDLKIRSCLHRLVNTGLWNFYSIGHRSWERTRGEKVILLPWIEKSRVRIPGPASASWRSWPRCCKRSSAWPRLSGQTRSAPRCSTGPRRSTESSPRGQPNKSINLEMHIWLLFLDCLSLKPWLVPISGTASVLQRTWKKVRCMTALPDKKARHEWMDIKMQK